MLDLPLAPKGVFPPNHIAEQFGGDGGEAATLRRKFTNRSTACLRHFLEPSEDDDNGGDDGRSKRLQKAANNNRRPGAPPPPGECGPGQCAVDTYCRMLRQSTSALGANLWTVKLGRWLVGELKTLASQAAAQAATWAKERKGEALRERLEDEQDAKEHVKEQEARAHMAAKAAAIKAEAAGITGMDRRTRRQLSSTSDCSTSTSSVSLVVSNSEDTSSSSSSNALSLDSASRRRRRRRSLLAKPHPPHLPPVISGPPPSRGFVLGLHLRMADCFTSADPDAKKQKCVGTKGFSPEHMPSIVRAMARLITDKKVPVPAAIFVASNWGGIFKVGCFIGCCLRVFLFISWASCFFFFPAPQLFFS